jgi:RNA polymerase sigma-70 factor (ECF subfamily)
VGLALTLQPPWRHYNSEKHVETVIPLFATLKAAPGKSLVAAARDGSRAAFGELYRQYARMVHGVLLTRVPHCEVEDMVQDVFLTALRRLSSLRDESAFGGWLGMIARNQAIDYHRKAPMQVELNENVSRQDPAPPEALGVLDAIRSLPDAYRETLVLRLVEGLTGPEIAAQTGLTADSVRVNLHRGMKMLREKIGGSAQ